MKQMSLTKTKLQLTAAGIQNEACLPTCHKVIFIHCSHDQTLDTMKAGTNSSETNEPRRLDFFRASNRAMDGSIQPTWLMNSPQCRQVGQRDWEQFLVPTGRTASAWRPLEGSLRVRKHLLASGSNFSPFSSSSPSSLSWPPPLFLDARRRALQPLRALHPSSLSIPLSSARPFLPQAVAR
jgi:hypothetical protein